MKKVYSPVKIELLDGEQNDSVSLKIENQYFFSNLNECKIIWKNKGKEGVLNTDIDVHQTKEIKLPFKYSELETLSLEVFNNSDVPVDQYKFDQTKPKIVFETIVEASFTSQRTENSIIYSSDYLNLEISKEKLKISDKKGHNLIEDWPSLIFLNLNSNGEGIQMTKKTPEFNILSNSLKNRKIESLSIDSTNSKIKIVILDFYQQASGTIELNIFANGQIHYSYEYFILEELNPRQWGMGFKVSNNFNQLSWKRKGIWSVYPDDHIARLQGTTSLFNENPETGLAGPSSLPAWTWSKDQNKYGSNNFRSTKRHILEASLKSKHGNMLLVNSDGLQNLRCWTNGKNINMLIIDYDNLGSEQFFRSHAQKWDNTLKTNDRIKGEGKINVLNEGNN